MKSTIAIFLSSITIWNDLTGENETNIMAQFTPLYNKLKPPGGRGATRSERTHFISGRADRTSDRVRGNRSHGEVALPLARDDVAVQDPLGARRDEEAGCNSL